MSKKVAVLVIHGMGSQNPNFAEDMIVEINDRVSNQSRNPNEIAWKKVFWADLVELRQEAYFRDTKRNCDIDYLKLRKFFLSAFGDASAYQQVKSDKNTTYELIHERVRDKIKELYEIDLQSQSCSLIILAHSLGGHIMSNYIWDVQHSSSNGLSSFEKLEFLSGMITFGCNIPLFTFAYKQVKPITFPGVSLSNDVRAKAKWLNYYDPDDILGYPLKTINEDYNNVVDKDIAINVGGIFSSWNPASHCNYWTDNDFTKPVSKFIAQFL